MASIVARIMGGTMFLGLGGLFGFLGVLALRRGYKFKKKGSVAWGAVIGCKQRRNDFGPSAYFPEIEFQTAKGDKVVFASGSGSSKIPTLGRKVKVLYYPDDPGTAEIAGSLWIGPFIIIIFASSFLVASVLFFAGVFQNPK